MTEPGSRILKLPHERHEVCNLPVLGELSIRDSIELKRHGINVVARGLECAELALVGSSDTVENGDKVSFGNDGRDWQLQVDESRTKPREVLLESFAPGALARQMIVVNHSNDLVEDGQIAAFNRREETAVAPFVIIWASD